MAGVPYVFGNATTSIPLTNLDANFNTGVTIGNTTVGLGNTVTTLGNVTLTNATVSSSSITDSGLTSGRAVYTGTGGLLSANANLTYDGTTFTAVNDASISGLTVGKGAGSNSTLLGFQAGSSATGNYMTAIGYQAGQNNTESTYGNTFIGGGAGKANTSGGGGTALGTTALALNTTGAFNSALGSYALQANTTGANNVAVGSQSLNANTTASNNTAVGYQAGYSNTTGALTAFGASALKANTTGTGNTGIGYTALFTNTTGNANTAIGGYDATNGINAALYQNQTGSFNIAVGTGALAANTTASNNTAVGYQAGYAITTGANSVFVGYTAGANATANNIICIGANTSVSSAADTYELVISTNGTAGKGSSTGFINANSGNIYQGNNSAAWSITSDQRLKKNIIDNTVGLSAINAIQVRNFEYRTADEVTDLPTTSAIDIQGVQLGAIAQELKEILPDCVKTESTGVMSVDTTNLTWYLINAVKELNAKITALENK